jgi:hypothetical protein
LMFPPPGAMLQAACYSSRQRGSFVCVGSARVEVYEYALGPGGFMARRSGF